MKAKSTHGSYITEVTPINRRADNRLHIVMIRCLRPIRGFFLLKKQIQNSIFAVFVLLSGLNASPQDAPVTLNVLQTPDGQILFDGWKFSTDDDPRFSHLNYDDAKWTAVEPFRLFKNLPKEIQTNDSGWLRLRFRTSDKNYDGYLLFLNNPAIEVYLNGKLLVSRGKFTADGVRAYSDYYDPVAIDLSPNSDYVLAVRYVWQPKTRSIYVNKPFFGAHFLTLPAVLRLRTENSASNTIFIFVAGIMLFLGIIHLVYLHYNRHKRANLYFAGFALLQSFFYSVVAAGMSANWLDMYLLYFHLGDISFLIGYLLALRALYVLFKFERSKWLPAIEILAVGITIYGIFSAHSQMLRFGAIILINIYLLALTLRAVYLKKRGSGIVLTGFTVGFAFIALFLIDGYMGIFGRSQLVLLLCQCMILLGPALGISIFLSREFALDARLLEVKLRQVAELSEHALQQEQEKQLLLSRQNEELEIKVEQRTVALRNSLEHLKQTQSQLIHSEKMASLGELTAGIAHEIQNPLNFVNNFSDVSIELLDEMEWEMKAGAPVEALSIAHDIRDNLTKIAHHGKRADSIVKGMLQHSRATSGQKEPTDINALVDEYLRLAFHGLRAKDKSFNAELVTDYGDNLPKIDIIPQDIGRALLNLFTNAFYATQERKKSESESYRPTVAVQTVLSGDSVEISVNDNGSGIPNAIKEKIFQPFFTTKPTGEGTGLGLSMTYDIIVKGHGGSLKVKSESGSFSQFLILLPIRHA